MFYQAESLLSRLHWNYMFLSYCFRFFSNPFQCLITSISSSSNRGKGDETWSHGTPLSHASLITMVSLGQRNQKVRNIFHLNGIFTFSWFGWTFCEEKIMWIEWEELTQIIPLLKVFIVPYQNRFQTIYLQDICQFTRFWIFCITNSQKIPLILLWWLLIINQFQLATGPTSGQTKRYRFAWLLVGPILPGC